MPVAFFRNLNVGQRGSPRTDDLLAAFRDAGATDVQGVRGNGTVLFTAGDPAATLTTVVAALHEAGPWNDVAFVRSVEVLRAVVERWGDRADEVSVLDVPDDGPSIGRRCRVLAVEHGFGLVVNERERESRGTPTLERRYGVPVTSRGLDTMHLVCARARS